MYDISLKNHLFFVILFNLFCLPFIDLITLFVLFMVSLYYFRYFLTLFTVLLAKIFQLQLNKFFLNIF